MSEQWKLVPVEPTEEMNKAGMRWLTGFQHMRAGDRRNALSEAFKTMLAVAPQPPALGGEPELVAYHCVDEYGQKKVLLPGAEGIGRHIRRGSVLKQLTYMDSTCRLLDEVERLHGRVREEQAYVSELAEAHTNLEARNAELEGLLRMFIDNSDDSDVVEPSRNALAEGKEHE